MIKVPLATVKDDLSGYVKRSARDEVLITRHGKPAAILIGFADEDDWFDYRLEHDERLLRRVAESREQVRRGEFTLLDELPDRSAGPGHGKIQPYVQKGEPNSGQLRHTRIGQTPSAGADSDE